MREKEYTEEEKQHIEAVRRLVDSGQSFAIFRLPEELEPHLMLQQNGEARPIGEEEEPCGFIVAPFHEDDIHPTISIRPDIYVHGWQEIEKATHGIVHNDAEKCSRKNGKLFKNIEANYEEKYKNFLEEISNGGFEKLVLSVSQQEVWQGATDPADAMVRAEKAFPHCMVYLLFTPTTGTWIGATPELLLHHHGEEWHTMSLAGTHMQGDGEWDTKNIHEQEVVTRYIHQTLNRLKAQNIVCDGPKTVKAGHLMHLRSDFTFHIPEGVTTMNLLTSLHPTPAVCGYPDKEKACEFILQNEGHERGYYSGFLGPMNIEGETRVYVNLRCAQLMDGEAEFHAGGGLTKMSQRWEEERELERKLSTLKGIYD